MEIILKSETKGPSIFKTVFEEALTGMVILKATRDEAEKIIDFEYIFVNKAGRSILGRDDLIGQGLLEVFPEHLQNGLFKRYVNVSETKIPEAIEFFYGKPYNAWALITAVPIENGISISFQDITKGKQLEFSASEETNRLLAFINNLPGGAVHRMGEAVTINRKVKEMLGYSQEEIKDIDTWFKLVHGEYYQYAREVYEEERATDFQGVGDLPVWTKCGQMLWIRFTAQSYDQGEVWFLQDITEHKKTELLNIDISKIVEESLNEIYIFDATSLKFVQVNKGGRDNLGYTLEELIQLTPVDIKPNQTKTSFLKLVQPLLSHEIEKLEFETVHIRKDQTTYPVEAHLQYASFGNQSVFVAIILDITERKDNERRILEYSTHLEQKVAERTRELAASEAKLMKALKKEMELSEMKSRFVAIASHEFRTPLATILTSAALVNRYNKPSQIENRKKHIDRIKSNVHNMRNILDDFLSLAKLEEGKITTHEESFDLATFFQKLTEELQGNTKQDQSIIYTHCNSETEVILDSKLLQNISNNLISNAIKYSGEGKDIQLNSYLDEHEIKIEIIDQGMGIPEEEQEHMFTRFFRAKNVTNIKGTGLGLTIVQRYVELMKGSISFTSKLEQGSTFTVTFPRNPLKE